MAGAELPAPCSAQRLAVPSDQRAAGEEPALQPRVLFGPNLLGPWRLLGCFRLRSISRAAKSPVSRGGWDRSPKPAAGLWAGRGAGTPGGLSTVLCPGESGGPAVVGGLGWGCEEEEHSHLLGMRVIKTELFPERDLPCVSFSSGDGLPASPPPKTGPREAVGCSPAAAQARDGSSPCCCLLCERGSSHASPASLGSLLLGKLMETPSP